MRKIRSRPRKPTEDELYGCAFYFALKGHESQYRKGTGKPYIDHPVCVSAILNEMQAGRDLIVAGFLHDVVEDTSRGLPEIITLFGEKVGRIVEAATENKNLSWKERKLSTINLIKKANYPVAILLLADKLDNMRSIATDYKICGEEIWERFSEPKTEQLWYYKTMAECFLKRMSGKKEAPFAEKFAELVNSVFD